MKTSSLEALLIDRALGELTPETIELVDLYLSEHPETGRLAGDLEQTLSLSRQATDLAPALSREAAPSRWAEITGSGRRRFSWPVSLGMAACLCLGLALGLSLRVQSPAAPAVYTALTPATDPGLRPTAPVSQGGLWSRARLIADSRPDTSQGAAMHQLAWDTHSIQPRLEKKQ